MKCNTGKLLFAALLVAAILLAPAVPAQAAGVALLTPPLSITGPRMAPAPVPHTMVWEPLRIETPSHALVADAWDGGAKQEAPGRGIKQTLTGYGAGMTLYDSPNVCNNFNAQIGWAASDGNPDIYTDWYSGWAPFALNEGIYQAKNVAFTKERSVGPGDRYNDEESKDGHEEHAVKIGSNQPYAAGFGSPRIPVPAGFTGGQVSVSVRYLIWDHDTGGGPTKDGLDYDWASMGIKPGADGAMAIYENGYVRGEWAELANTVPLGDAQDIMVLIQGQSPGPFNSNIYFDDVKIAFTSPTGEVVYLADCSAEEAIR